MTDELRARIERLRRKWAAATDPEDQADYQASIDALEKELVSASHTQALSGHAQTGAAVAGGVTGNVVAPLFPAGASGNNIAGVINLYQHAPAAPQADYGPALRRYLEHLYACHATLDLRGIDDRPMDMPLSELYVSLKLHEPPPDALRGAGGLRGFVEKMRGVFTSGQSRDQDLSLHDAEVASHEPVSWAHVLRHRRVAVVGAPGSGKTTLLHYTAVRLAEVLARDDDPRLADLGLAGAPPVPLLLPLRELGEYLQESGQREVSGANPALLMDCLTNYYNRFELNLPPDFFRRLCDKGRALLLLDGLDEVARADDRVLVSAIVRSFAQRYGDCHYVVTARVAAYQGDAQIGAGFRISTVADLDADQQQRFIANWSRSLHRLLYNLSGDDLTRTASRYADDLMAALASNDRVRELATNPLLLTVVAVIFYNNYVLPEDRAALYEECVEVLLRGGRGKADRAAQQRANYSGRAEVSMSLKPKRELLAAVAYAMHQRGEEGIVISKHELGTLVTDHLAQRVATSEAEAIASAFVDELPVHIGLLDEREPDRFRFSHLSFQEFLAARYLAEADRWDELLAHYQETWWREVILLCAGYLSQERCWKFLTALIARGSTPTEKATALGLAAVALAELERAKKEQGPLNAQIIADALAIFDAPCDAAPAQARVTAGHVLAQLGDSRPGVCTLPPPMVAFTGGSFVIGSSPAEAEQAGKQWEQYFLEQGDKATAKQARQWPEDEINDQPLTLAAFELARFPVTNAQYALFIADDGYNPARSWWDDAAQAWLARDDQRTDGLHQWQQRTRKDAPEFWNHPRFGRARANHPVVGVSWYEATAFCRWLTQHAASNPKRYSYRLPSEAEWEYAARGMARRVYPWGPEQPDSERANFNQTYNGTTAVGSFPTGATPPPESLADMAGNVWEWTASVYAPYADGQAPVWQSPEAPAQKRFTLRGGGWYNPPIIVRASLRLDYSPDGHYYGAGFRLARHLPAD